MPLSLFSKMHGCGNSFLVALANAAQVEELLPFIPGLCSPSFGVGSDGTMLIEPRPDGVFEVYMHNPDGSPMGMCGNGIRCVARFLFEKRLVTGGDHWVRFLVEGRSIECRIHEQGRMIEVNMGAPRLEPADLPMKRDGACIDQPLRTSAGDFLFTGVSMGNPHCVIFSENIEAVDLSSIGPVIEHHEDFPRRINVEFCAVLNKGRLRVRVWERGAGITLACGTGACASLVAGVLSGRCDPLATVELPGGEVVVRWDREQNLVFMTGPASSVAECSIGDEFFSASVPSQQRAA